MPAAPDADNVRYIKDPGCQQMVGFETRLDSHSGECVVTLELEARHLNRHGILHGGLAATLLDVVCGNTASHYFDPVNHAPLVTVSLNLSYVAAVHAGQVTATARPAGGGKSIAYINGELRDADGRMMATATGIFKRTRT